ncbi:hypothetical protein NDU88_005075 [Pleurodeles waltl]|uniref:Uncharacterized protein n=1 Tax=Pleurodeles waltl TaxID=8319 RepID=A0AAV7M9Z3_PLEWA|nr:hypothetical protein NDU88_005075 [Pleurodeles waltl]
MRLQSTCSSPGTGNPTSWVSEGGEMGLSLLYSDLVAELPISAVWMESLASGHEVREVQACAGQSPKDGFWQAIGEGGRGRNTHRGVANNHECLEEQVCSLTSKSSKMEARLQDQEGRSRRNNGRVVRVPEGLEGPSTDFFVEDLVLNKLKPKRLFNFFLCTGTENARSSPKPEAPPRTIIPRIVNYRNRNASLQAASSHGDLHLDNDVIRFYPDFTLHVQRQQKHFEEVKKALRAKEVKYIMPFPAKL